MAALPLLTVAHVSTAREWYGGEEQACLLAEGLRTRGHTCVVFSRQGSAFARGMADRGFEVRPISGAGRSPRALIRLRRELVRLKPDILHAHDAHAVTCAGLAAIKLGIPARVASRRVDYPLRSLGKYQHLWDRVVGVSDMVRQVCLKSGLSPDRIRVVHSGVDPKRVQSGDRSRGRAALGIDPDTRVLITTASLSTSKGHEDLLNAMPRILEAHPRTHLVLAGTGHLHDELQAQASELSLNGAVRFLDYRDDIPDLMKAADVFVLPSRVEALGTSLIDAMMGRVPIVTTTVGGIPELVGARGNEPPVASMVAPAEPEALAEAILNVLEAPESQRDMIDRAERRALDHFSDSSMVDGMLEVYGELLA